MAYVKSCKICGNSAKFYDYNTEKSNEAVDCSYCGKYYELDSKESGSFETDIYKDKSNFYKVSSWIREENDEFNMNPDIDNEKFNELLNMRDKKIQEKFDLMMVYLASLSEHVHVPEDIIIKCWIKNDKELNLLFQKALDRGLIEGEITNFLGGNSIQLFNSITFDGLEYIESLDNINQSSKDIFVAFNFENNITEIFNTYVKEAIEELGFNYIIVTQDTTTHDKAISDEIISKLKSSRIVIADFTNHRQSVYFEAGFAMGSRIPIIWTCQDGHENELSFDTRQYPHLVWKDGEDLKKQITNRIKVII